MFWLALVIIFFLVCGLVQARLKIDLELHQKLIADCSKHMKNIERLERENKKLLTQIKKLEKV